MGKENTTTMLYSGNIALSILINNKIYKLNTHNQGTSYLKYVFAKALLFDLEKCDTPGYVSLVKTEGGVDYVCLSNNLTVSAKLLVDYQDSVPTAISLTAYIPYDLLLSEIDSTDSSDYYITLLTHPDSKNAQHELARFKVSAATLAYITPGATAILNWTLRLQNINEVE